MNTNADRTPQNVGESGAALIVALVILLAISVAILAVSNFAVGAATNTYNVQSQRLRIANAESAVSAAITNLRGQYSPTGTSGVGIQMFSGTPEACLPTGITSYPSSYSPASGPQMYVTCTGTFTGGSVPTRVVNFYACTASACSSSSTQLVMTAVVDYDDIDPAAPSGSSACTSTCGYSISLVSWDVRAADG